MPEAGAVHRIPSSKGIPGSDIVLRIAGLSPRTGINACTGSTPCAVSTPRIRATGITCHTSTITRATVRVAASAATATHCARKGTVMCGVCVKCEFEGDRGLVTAPAMDCAMAGQTRACASPLRTLRTPKRQLPTYQPRKAAEHVCRVWHGGWKAHVHVLRPSGPNSGSTPSPPVPRWLCLHTQRTPPLSRGGTLTIVHCCRSPLLQNLEHNHCIGFPAYALRARGD
jgi:hypothetical protein